MGYKELLEKHGSIRKAAEAIGTTKSKFMVAHKKELGLCTATTGCQSQCEPNRTRCSEHLKYAVKTRDPIKKKAAMTLWVRNNREYVRHTQKKYQQANLDKFRQGSKRYRKTPRGRAVEAARTAKYRASKLQATPPWVDKLQLLEIYENRPSGFHVDHIIPLQNDQVCGLHVPWNLQYLTVVDNDSKGNSFDGTYNNDSWKSLNKECHQYIRRLETKAEDESLGFRFDLKASDFDLSFEPMSKELKDFIKKYEWLGTTGWLVKWCFTARHEGKLAGVVMLSEPVAPSIFGKALKYNVEALVQRGACSSWAPKNLNSRLVMFACRWMVENTDRRVFIGYSDPSANEYGTIYQACNFMYLGAKFGNKAVYTLPNGKKVGSRYFTRTSSMKKWAKELGIQWQPSWSKNNGYQNVSAIPKTELKALRDYASRMMKKCPKSEKQKKGKYALILTKKREKALRKTLLSLVKPEPYPKR